MYVMIIPVSGGGFVSQLGIIQHICEMGIKPDLIMASSGGNVAAYIAAAAKWKWPGIERIAEDINQNMFIKPWSNISSISLLFGYFKCDIYDHGDGVKDFFYRYFNSKNIGDYEIWTGTYNKTRQKSSLFCNRSRNESILDPVILDHELTQSLDPIYLDRNIDMIAKASIASASIPSIVPAEIINNEEYVDGGVSSASPFIIMQDAIRNHIIINNKKMHLIYINSIDLSQKQIKPCNNIIDNWRQSMHNIVRSQTVIDRLAAYQLLRFFPGEMNKEEFSCSYENLQRVKRIQKKYQYSLLEIYPLNYNEVNILNFTGNNVIEHIRNVYPNCACRFWWLT